MVRSKQYHCPGEQARPSTATGIPAHIPRLWLGTVQCYCGLIVHHLFTFPHDFSSVTLVLIFRQYCVNPHLQKWVPHRFKLREWKLLVKKDIDYWKPNFMEVIFNFFKSIFIEVELIYHLMSVSGIQRSD